MLVLAKVQETKQNQTWEGFDKLSAHATYVVVANIEENSWGRAKDARGEFVEMIEAKCHTQQIAMPHEPRGWQLRNAVVV